MKVLMTTDTVGGVWQYSLQLARALERHSVRVYLATMGAPLTDTQRSEAAAIPSLEISESNYKLEWMADPWDDVASAGEWLLGLEREVRPDLVHLNGYTHGSLPWRAPVLVVGHSCVLSWWEAVRGEAAPPSWNRYRHEVARGLRGANMVVAPTEAMLHELERLYGPLPESLIIYNGRDGSDYPPREKEDYVLSVGRLWDEAKNVAALGEIAPRLGWPVFVAGDTRHPDGGSTQLDNMLALGQLSRSELSRVQGAASIYALPARYEPFGLSVLEAGLAGCALVLGDIPTLREVWGSAALLVPPDDRLALNHAIRKLIDDPLLRNQMAARARSRAQFFSLERMAGAYMDAYRRKAPVGIVSATQAVAVEWGH